MGARTGNPVWVDSTDAADAAANPSRKITAAKLNAIEAAIDDMSWASITGKPATFPPTPPTDNGNGYLTLGEPS